MLGMLGRGDGFPLGRDGLPSVALPNGQGELVHAFHMPSECMTNGVGNDWNTGHHSYDNGTNRGFVEASTGETMGYFLGTDMPFTWGLARAFPIADRWFCSAMAQTDPNRRYLFAGTSLGLINDSFPSELPPNGTIFDSLNKYGITWKDYYSDAPTALVWIGLASQPSVTDKFVKTAEFFEDAAAGRLPQFSMLDPNYTVQSEENPQDVQFGDQYLSDVINAVMQGPQWPHTLLIWTYDEWGGWYDHVPPPYVDYDGLGFRVPLLMISPYAKQGYVTHVQYEHGSLLRFVEDQYGLGQLSASDTRANDPATDAFDFTQKPREFVPFASKRAPGYFLHAPVDTRVPDSE
jgi:phospholipase C